MRILSSVVLPSPALMVAFDPKLPDRGAVRSQVVCDQPLRNKGILLQELAHQFQRGMLVALRLAGDQVGSPEPSGQWRVTALHDRADSQSCLTSAVAACQHTRAGRDAKRLTSDATMRTDEAVPPAHLFEVFGAGGIAREEPLKLRQRPRKRQPRVLVDVHENQR